MSSHRYQRVDAHDDDEDDEMTIGPSPSGPLPSSPPPSFHSRSSSPTSRLVFSQDPLHSEADQTLADAFGDDGGDSDAEEEMDDRQRLMRGNNSTSGLNADAPYIRGVENVQQPPVMQRTIIQIPAFNPPTAASARVVGGAGTTNDGVFANLAAKPERGEKDEDLPPTYEQAAADATPPYWETTVVAPGMSSDEVYVDGLPVGSVFSFIWNGMISTSFQLVGFLLTYLLHTTHAAKNGSRAGLGLTLVQYGFYMKGSNENKASDADSAYANPPDPNSHDFSPGSAGDGSHPFDAGTGAPDGMFASITTSEWISYILMIVGWFILIRAVSDFLRARRHEQLILQSPDRGLSVPIIVEGERVETVV